MSGSKVFHSNFYAMGTRMDVVLPNIDSEEGDEVFQSIRLEVKRLEKKLSRFDKNSMVYLINEHAAKEEIKVDTELFKVLSDCSSYFFKSSGYFDITQRKLMNYWKSEEKDEETFKTLKEKLGMDKIRLDENKKTVKFDNEEVEIDLGGYGKGYALQGVRTVLAEHMVSNCFISFGESSVLTLGTHPHGDYWGVGIRNLLDQKKNAYSFQITNGSVSTSGVTPLKKGLEWGHVINPKTGIPVRGAKTVSVHSGSPLEAEVLSTILLISDPEDVADIISQFKIREAVEIVYADDTSYTAKKLVG